MSLDVERRALLAAALTRVPFDGWTDDCLAEAASAAGFEPIMARRLFPRGIGAALDFLMAEADRGMGEQLANHDLEAMRIRDRIATAVRLRIEQHHDHREAIRRALALQATPQYAPAALAGLYRTVDLIWRAAGDRSTDFNFYTKRALLAGVYGATLLYWLEDRSPGAAQSWSFLTRRIEDVMRIQKFRGRLDRFAEQCFQGLAPRWSRNLRAR